MQKLFERIPFLPEKSVFQNLKQAISRISGRFYQTMNREKRIEADGTIFVPSYSQSSEL